jgi:hypothetical protein
MAKKNEYELCSFFSAYANTPVTYRDRLAPLTWNEVYDLIREAEK